jgi:hypothetical protein
MIDYVLEENRWKGKTDDRYARVVNQRTYTDNDLADAIVLRNFGISKVEALAMIEAISEIQLQWIADGNAIKNRLAHYHAAITGSYGDGEYPTEAVVRITPSREFTEAVRKNSLRHVEPLVPMSINDVKDFKSDTFNRFITSGGSVKIHGHNIKIAGTEDVARIEFVSAENPNTVYPVPRINVLVNSVAELLFLAPEMPANETVRLKITTQHSSKSTRLLKKPRSLTFQKIFTVL